MNFTGDGNVNYGDNYDNSSGGNTAYNSSSGNNYNSSSGGNSSSSGGNTTGGNISNNVSNTGGNVNNSGGNNNSSSSNSQSIVINNVTGPSAPQPMYMMPPPPRTFVQRVLYDTRRDLCCIMMVLVLYLIPAVLLLLFYAMAIIFANFVLLVVMNHGMTQGGSTHKAFSFLLAVGNIGAFVLLLVAAIFTFISPCVFPAYCNPLEFLLEAPYWVYIVLMMLCGLCQFILTIYSISFASKAFRGPKVDTFIHTEIGGTPYTRLS